MKFSAEVNEFLKKNSTSRITTGVHLDELLKRTELTYESLSAIDKDRPCLTRAEKEQVEVQIKYEGYINRQMIQIGQFKKLEKKMLPKDIDYNEISGLALEARQKLNKQKPESIGQASRISGVSPADISVLLVWLAMKNKK